MTLNIPTMNPNERGDNKSSNESNYFIDETSTFETDMVFNSRQDLIDWVQNVGRGIGYVIVIKNSRHYCTPLTDDDITYEVLQNKFDDKFKSQSRFGKLSLLKKFQNINFPSTTSVGEPSIQKNTRGRPSLKNKIFRKTKIDSNQNPQAEDPPNQDPRSQNPCRRSISTYMPDYVRSNSFDLNQEPDRHSSSTIFRFGMVHKTSHTMNFLFSLTFRETIM
ncbi:hypothetical protein LXL04_015319 [Taraxacum kok-saghyz]